MPMSEAMPIMKCPSVRTVEQMRNDQWIPIGFAQVEKGMLIRFKDNGEVVFTEEGYSEYLVVSDPYMGEYGAAKVDLQLCLF